MFCLFVYLGCMFVCKKHLWQCKTQIFVYFLINSPMIFKIWWRSLEYSHMKRQKYIYISQENKKEISYFSSFSTNFFICLCVWRLLVDIFNFLKAHASSFGQDKKAYQPNKSNTGSVEEKYTMITHDFHRHWNSFRCYKTADVVNKNNQTTSKRSSMRR